MTFTLIAINIVAFFLEQRDPNLLIGLFALWPPSPAVAADEPIFQVWQLLSYSALHANPMHLLFNMFGLYMFGREVEQTIGHVRVAALYVASVVSGALVQIAVSLASTHSYPTIGASAGVFGLLVSYAMLFPHRRVVLLFPPIPMPAWVFATGYGVLELFLGASGEEADVAHFAHIGGMLGAIALMVYWSRTRRHSWID
ncbi:rhomboid family intramembrane serine protease [Paraburkholderia sp. RL17-373-BIF-A]|uniref:rhomboid family intramembrane serine protease n=1 Tax=Paraburkholderia sp. RL17-373-BIF-A TaxID=3031629 RepID=UPI0038B9AFFD